MPWGHHMVLLDKLGSPEELLWYAAAAAENGWSRKVLTAQIASDLHGRHGSAMTSFDRALPAADSELVRDALKDPYNFEFLNLSADAKERDLEDALLNDVQSFLMEMGRGFALVGRQFPRRVTVRQLVLFSALGATRQSLSGLYAGSMRLSRSRATQRAMSR